MSSWEAGPAPSHVVILQDEDRMALLIKVLQFLGISTQHINPDEKVLHLVILRF